MDKSNYTKNKIAYNHQDLLVPELLTFLLVSLGFVFTVIFTGGLSPTSLLTEFLTLTMITYTV